MQKHRELDAPGAIPLSEPPDAEHARYFQDVKRAIERHWAYPRDAVENHQCGWLILEFVVHRDGTAEVDLVRSSGVEILDRYAINAVKLATPFPAIPNPIGADRIRISASFTYILDPPSPDRPSQRSPPSQPQHSRSLTIAGQ